MEEGDKEGASEHYVNNVMELSRKRKVVATEDLYDSRGIKLVSKGAVIEEGMKEKLVRFKLRQPLESTLAVEGGIDTGTLVKEANSLLETLPHLASLMDHWHSRTQVLSVFKELHLDRASTLLLTMERENKCGVLHHCILAAMTAVSLGNRLGFDKNDLLNLGIAGMLHDIGELYINPEFRKPSRPLTPQEWKHIVTHPRIGQLVIEESTRYPKAVSLAIAEHHERPNGFGYPRRLASNKLSKLGNIMLVAEVLAGLIVKEDRPLERASLAVKVIPGEYPKEIVSMIACVQRESGSDAEPDEAKKMQMLERARLACHAMDEALVSVEAAPIEVSRSNSALLDQVRERLVMMRQAVHATGLSACNELEMAGSGDIALEMETVIYEIVWRLRELSRQISLGTLTLEQDAKSYFSALTDILEID